MGNPTFLDRARGFIGGIAWRVFLWSLRMTDEEYDYHVHIACEPMDGAPMKYWQHEETGRVCSRLASPSERWYEITEGHYNVTLRHMSDKKGQTDGN